MAMSSWDAGHDHGARMRRLNGEPADRSARELVGVVAAVVWAAEDGSAVIARLQSGEVVRGPLAGEGEEVEEGTKYRFLGRWQEHAKHGVQFAFATYVRDTPHSRAGVLKYLADEAPNVGQRRALQLYATFGADAVAVLRAEPARVVAAGILNTEQADEAADALRAAERLERTKIDLFSLFAGRGFPGRLIQACIDEWGARAAETIRRNPFALLINELPGCGFKRTDRLYLDLGFPSDRLKRQMLCAWHALREDTTGHTWSRRGAATEAIVRTCAGRGVDPDRALELGLRGGWLSAREQPAGVWWLAESGKAAAERRLADAVRRLLRPCAVDWPDVLPLEAFLSNHQREKIILALARPLGVLSGTPGTGKTYTAAAVIRQVKQRWGAEALAVAAPTGKAAVRISAALDQYRLGIAATTIHRLLEIGRNGRDGKGWGFQRNATNPLSQRFLFVDEASMLDTSLAADLLDACADGTHVLLIGDQHQLPPVGHGAPLRDLLAAGVPNGELSEIRRNAGAIVEACADMKAGRRFTAHERYEPAEGRNLKHVEVAEPTAAVETLRTILRQFRASGKFDPVWDVQILTPLNAKSPVARVPLNRVLQAELNPPGLTAPPNPFKVGDKVICLKNSWMGKVERKSTRLFGPGGEALPPAGLPADPEAYIAVYAGPNEPDEVFLANGDVGRVLAVGPRVTIATFTAPERTIKIPMGRVREEEREEGDDGTEIKGAGCDFALAYCITGHKSQGSEWPVVIVMLDENARLVACREWHYTAISRATRLTILVGKRAVIDRQCKVVSLPRRKTFLAQMLTASGV